MHEKAISLSVEMYLVTIYRLTGDDSMASTHDIADLLDVSLPSVTGQLKKLTEKGYVEYVWREGARLTDDGRVIALNVLRKNRLIKTFLFDRTNYQLHELFDEACFMEHVVSDRFADALDEMLEYPKIDPHGLPIPDKDGTISDLEGVRLNEADAPSQFEVVRLEETNRDVLDRFRELGLLPKIVVSYSGRVSDGFCLRTEKKEFVLPDPMGKHLTVRVL